MSSQKKRLIKTIIILPINVTVFIPALILFFSSYSFTMPNLPVILISLIIALFSIFMAVWTIRLFATIGEATPAPWDAPTKLVLAGPYLYVRNPMMSAVFTMLLAISLFLWSYEILIWFLIFLIANLFYLPLSEEKNLEKRFGEDYIKYKANVPRWIPRLTPYQK